MPRGRPKSKPATTEGAMSKMDAMRRALAELGAAAKPAAIQSYLQKQFGIGMATTRISNYKSYLVKKAGKGPKPAPAAQGPPKEPPPGGKGTGSKAGIVLEDIQAVKELASRIGAAKLKDLVDLLTK